ncbi:MAG: hypothetical protein L3J05_03705 [Robiginitomaculum sp.]|nr:hypothetical protein [Robiginitomaculum sp.]
MFSFTKRLQNWVCTGTAAFAYSGIFLLQSVTSSAGTVDRPFFRAQSIVVVLGGDDFSENGGTALFAVDFNLLDSASGTLANDIIAADGVTTNYNTGQFNAISNGTDSGYEFEIIDPVSGGVFTSVGPHQTLDANDSYSEFELDGTTDIDLVTGRRSSQFLVASNAAFDIYAQATDLVATGDFSAYDYSNIRYRLRLRVARAGVHGANAQNPSNGGSGIITSINRLNLMSAAPTKVFDGGRRTARSRGSLLDHAVSFQSRYNLRGAGAAVNNYDLSMGAGALGATVTYTIYTP